ncbi:transposase, IS30 family [Sphaerochaeta pleomorpha str. Grapes]|uniref:Transposase, IS30 family n=1 Tax=Sphaerochaeta pleomorpha (strain ATCC BAA-1885 / DSM 22778 / Grapes) TaxID=158190 RepID=G8QQP0_SPHPG|nr:IS30 family transposase [Sphaerochaeta pleomorpha]AEV30970.1 transposase, IS30 family [Sphaerochaeta pleomorpha str. Grapes]
MGRRNLTLGKHCRGSHFSWGERLKLQYYFAGSNGYRKERSPTVLGMIFQKSAKTIGRELQRGMVEHVLGEIPFSRAEYNADHAQIDAEEKMKYKGPLPKSGRHYALVQRISPLILKDKYSPYAVLKTLDKDEEWPEGLRICEKTLYNWIEAGDIPGVTIENLPRRGKVKHNKGHGGKRKHSNAEFAARSIEHRPREILRRLVAGHWEGDTVYSRKNGSKECLLTLVERSTRMELILKIPDRTAKSVKEAFDKLERQLGSRLFRLIFLSVTFDNGSEFSDVLGLEKSILTKGTRTVLYCISPIPIVPVKEALTRTTTASSEDSFPKERTSPSSRLRK